jgi:outer membrane autotransporter protein
VPLTGSAAAQAFDALSGEIHASLASALFADSRFLANAAFDHLREDHASGRTAFWIEGSAIRNRFRSDGNAAAADANFAGIAAGADYATSNIVRVGLSGGYSSTHEKDPGRSSDGKVKSFHAAAYGGASFDGWNVQGAAGYDWHDVDTSREIAFPGIAEAADASYHAHSIEASGEISYRHAIDAFWLEPLGRFDWVQLKTDAFAESGGVTALSGTQQSQQVEFLTAGVRTGARFAEGGMGLTPHILLAWQHSVGDRTPASPLSFQNTGVSFMTNGAPIDTDSLLAGAGLDVAFGDRVKANLSYAGTIGHYVTSHAAMADISVQF